MNKFFIIIFAGITLFILFKGFEHYEIKVMERDARLAVYLSDTAKANTAKKAAKEKETKRLKALVAPTINKALQALTEAFESGHLTQDQYNTATKQINATFL